MHYHQCLFCCHKLLPYPKWLRLKDLFIIGSSRWLRNICIVLGLIILLGWLGLTRVRNSRLCCPPLRRGFFRMVRKRICALCLIRLIRCSCHLLGRLPPRLSLILYQVKMIDIILFLKMPFPQGKYHYTFYPVFPFVV